MCFRNVGLSPTHPYESLLMVYSDGEHAIYHAGKSLHSNACDDRIS